MILPMKSFGKMLRSSHAFPWTLTCLSLSLLFVGCRPQAQAPQSLPLYADAIVKKDFRQVVNAEGMIGNNNYVPFRPSQSGIVTQVLVKAGQKVKKGQVMFVLEHESQRAALDTAKAKAQEAKIEASRYQFLYAAGAATLEEAEQYRITAIARHNESIDKRVQLSHRSIKAPFDGVIGTNFVVNVGTYIQSGDILGGLVNNDELFVQMNVPAAQAASIQLGQVVRIYSGGSDRSIAEGQVDYVAPYFDSGSDGTSPTNTLTVQASFPNVQAGLKPGEVLRSEIQTGVRHLPAIPTAAITMKAQQAFVFKLVPVTTFLRLNNLDEKQSQPLKALPSESLIAMESPVTLGELQENQFPVLKGLAPGDQVAISQTKVLFTGMPVTILPDLPSN